MVRTQLYLPDNLYAIAKKEAEKNKTSFAHVVRLSLERMLIKKPYMTDKELRVRFPILKFSGMAKGESSDFDNNNIDDFLYGTEQEK